MRLILNVCASIALFALIGSAQDMGGKWSGIFRSTGPAGKLEMSFVKSGESWTGTIALKFDGRETTAEMGSLIVRSDGVGFSAPLGGSDSKFEGKQSAGKLVGTFEVFEKGVRELSGVYCVARPGGPGCDDSDMPPIPAVQVNSQRADEAYDTGIKEPAYRSRHPRVLFDEAHRNFHKSTTNFKPFADLVRADGYQVTPNTVPFSAASLAGYDVLVISNARGNPNESAFTEAECGAVLDWVRAGGSLLLIADHAPFGGYSEKLSNRFGVDMSKGYTDDPMHRDPVIKDLLFSRENHLLGDHPITRGRNAGEKISRVVSFTGQSLKAAGGTGILNLGDSAYDEFPNSDKKVPAAGRTQAVAIKLGKGRVFISGEAAMLTAQIAANGEKFGMNVAGIDNRQFALNIMHWLSGLLK